MMSAMLSNINIQDPEKNLRRTQIDISTKTKLFGKAKTGLPFEQKLWVTRTYRA